MKEKRGQLKEKLEKLDTTYPPVSWQQEELWQAIEGKNNSNLWFYAAASVVVIMALAILTYTFNASSTVDSPFSADRQRDATSVSVQAEAIIRDACQSQLPVCQSEEFRFMQDQLQLLKKELQELQSVSDQYGENEMLIRSKIQLENDKARVTQELINMIVS